MDEIIKQIRNNSRLRIFYGIFLVLLGILVHMIPLVPASWIIVIGLEVLGIRLLVQDLVKSRAKNSKFFSRFFEGK